MVVHRGLESNAAVMLSLRLTRWSGQPPRPSVPQTSSGRRGRGSRCLTFHDPQRRADVDSAVRRVSSSGKRRVDSRQGVKSAWRRNCVASVVPRPKSSPRPPRRLGFPSSSRQVILPRVIYIDAASAAATRIDERGKGVPVHPDGGTRRQKYFLNPRLIASPSGWPMVLRTAW